MNVIFIFMLEYFLNFLHRIVLKVYCTPTRKHQQHLIVTLSRVLEYSGQSILLLLRQELLVLDLCADLFECLLLFQQHHHENHGSIDEDGRIAGALADNGHHVRKCLEFD